MEPPESALSQALAICFALNAVPNPATANTAAATVSRAQAEWSGEWSGVEFESSPSLSLSSSGVEFEWIGLEWSGVEWSEVRSLMYS